MYIPDEQNAKELQLSNDAFFYLLNEDEPLDEDNLEEAQEVLGMFKYGFSIKEGWSYVDDDLIEATFVPYKPDTHNYDLEYQVAATWVLRLKWQNAEHTKIKVWSFNPITGKLEEYGDFDVQVNAYGLKYFQKPSAISNTQSVFYLKHFKSRAL